MTAPTVTVGTPNVLGAAPVQADADNGIESGVNFAVYSEGATRVEICLFDEEGGSEQRFELPGRTHGIWHGHISGVKPGDLYGLRAHGPYEPAQGLRFNPSKLLLDPYAKAIVGPLQWNRALYAYDVQAQGEEGERDDRPNDEDSAPYMPKSQVVGDEFDWGEDRRPAVPMRETIFYEAHVKGCTQRHPDVPEALRGSYAGMSSPEVIDHLRKLGVTSVELLPVHAFIDDQRLVDAGRRNYWGYNTIGFFAPEPRYVSRQKHRDGTMRVGVNAVHEFKSMVKALHAAGIEVILDVVYNHTAEGNHLGPTLCHKGIDNASYYRLSEEDRRYYVDYTGTGNTVNTYNPVALRMIMDSLRYWATEMHVDGFRFDLASTLGRSGDDFDRRGGFFAAVGQDPVLAGVKLVAEPWDVGATGYQVGGFPTRWAEWNGKYRDAVRSYWKGDAGLLAEFSHRLCGSSDLFDHSERNPNDSVNIVTVHDGFTLRDLVSYNDKHNEANGEDNRDGESNNHSWNCGAEGPTDDPAILELRSRMQRNMLTTLFVSQGTPLLLAGDELGRTQQGNNNGYCQDNEISWLDWKDHRQPPGLLDYVRRVIAFRQANPALRRSTFFTGEPDEAGHRDITWLNPDGQVMSNENWSDGNARAMCAVLCGRNTGQIAPDGSPLTSDSVMLLFNAHHETVDFTLPEHHEGGWTAVFDTAAGTGLPTQSQWAVGDTYPVEGRSMVVLAQPGG